MGYLLALAGTFCGVCKGYCGKKVSNHIQKTADIMLTNLLRMILCIIIGFFAVMFTSGIPSLAIDSTALIISFISGLANSAFIVFWVISVRQSAYMLIDVFGTLGLAVPLIMGSLLFNEHIRSTQYIGFIILIAAAFVMCSYNNTFKAKLNLKSFGTLLLCGFTNGMIALCQKLFVNYVPNASISVFNFYTYLFAALTLGICYIIFRAADKEKSNFSLKSVSGYILAMAGCLFLYSYLLTAAALHIDSIQLYPLNTGLSLVLSAGMSAAFLGERITRRCVIGVSLTFVALLIINVL